MTNKPDNSTNSEAKVGRGSPPKHTQFRKGTSGNLLGRPKGSKNLSTLIMEAANAEVTATIDGKPRRISKLQATAMQLATKASKGDQSAINKFLDWVDEIETGPRPRGRPSFRSKSAMSKCCGRPMSE